MISLLDTHQHLIYPNVAGYSWTDDIPVLADKAFTLPDYQKACKGKGVIKTLFMEAGADDADYQAETRFIAKLAADKANEIVGLIASCRPELDEAYDAWLEECVDLPVVGFRRILHVVNDELSESESFRANVRKIGDRNLNFDMCFLARQLPIALELARACDNTRLILNHCGVPDIANGEFGTWQKGISKLAELPHVACKVSGVMAYCAPKSASLETLRPYLDHVVAAFGPDRLVWGSDWPVVYTAAGAASWITASRDFLATMSAGDADKLAHANASRLYRLPL